MVASHDCSTSGLASATVTVSGWGSTRSLISTKIARLNRYIAAPHPCHEHAPSAAYYADGVVDFPGSFVKAALSSQGSSDGVSQTRYLFAAAGVTSFPAPLLRVRL